MSAYVIRYTETGSYSKGRKYPEETPDINNARVFNRKIDAMNAKKVTFRTSSGWVTLPHEIVEVEIRRV